MIRAARLDDVPQITEIYNHYILNSVWTFEVDPVSEDEMRRRMEAVNGVGPFLVFVEGPSGAGDGVGCGVGCDEGVGAGVGCERVLGYAYAHPWKERPAYFRTFETTVYVRSEAGRKGVGSRLMSELVCRCRELQIHALIACITGCNFASIEMHKKLGFKQVSLFEEVGMKFGRVLDVVDLELVI